MKITRLIVIAILLTLTSGSKILSQVKVASNLNVGIGIEPLEKLHINGSLRGNQSGAIRINSGPTVGWVDVGCKNNSFAHFYTDRSMYYFDKKIIIGGDSKISSYGTASTSDLILCTSSYATERIRIQNSNGYIGIGMTPSYRLDVNGYVRATNISVSSDERLKRDIADLDISKVSDLMGLKAKTYKPVFRVSASGTQSDSSLIVSQAESIQSDTTQHVSLNEQEPERTMIGYIASELKNYFPELVSEDKEGYLSVDYISLIPVIISALQQQNATITGQNEKIEELEKKIAGLSVKNPR